VLLPGGSISRYAADIEMISIASNFVKVNGFLAKDPETGLYQGDRPENITIQNCSVEGKVTITGIPGPANGPPAWSSHDAAGISSGAPSHVDRARALAPTKILFNNVVLIAVGSTPLYVRDGVTRFTLLNSRTTGQSGSDVGIYLDQESTENTILNSLLSVVTEKAWPKKAREQVALDAASYNFLVGNTVSQLDDGGFNLYRNCGEHGAIRYSTPSYNVIFGNRFNYRKYHQPILTDRRRYAVHLSSRNGAPSDGNDYCNDDRYAAGTVLPLMARAPIPPADLNFPRNIDTSFTTEHDNAHDNIVTGNEFLNRNPKPYIENNSAGYFNLTVGNREVSAFSTGKKACFSAWSFGRVLLHGNTENVWATFDGEPFCIGYTCNNGTLEPVVQPTCPEPGDAISVECRAEQDNNGCQNFLSCPLGQRVASVKAACNLELGTVTDADLASVPFGSVKVVTQSQNRDDGQCYVLSARRSSAGTSAVTINQDVRTVNIGCVERDSNGGDCHVRAEFTCEEL
jgi:hypothetical protein